MAQEGAPSERACDRCRERRVKCDKRQPSCLRCEKLGKSCPGYDKKRKFVDEGASLRKKYQASTTTEIGTTSEVQRPAVGGSRSKPRESVFASGALQCSPSEQLAPQRVETSTFLTDALGGATRTDTSSQDAAPSFHDTNPLWLPHAEQAHTDADAILNDILSDPSFDPSWFDIEPMDFYGTGDDSCGFIPNIPKIIDEVDRDNIMQSTETSTVSPMSGLGFFSDNTLFAPESQLNTSAMITDEREHEMAYLIRHFTEAIGPWMDLFDQEKHFGNLVPLKALRDALLRNAIAAVAAKQLGLVKGTKPYLGVQSQKPATMEVIEDMPEVDWFYKAANYYDKAIAFSRIYLQAISGSLSNPPTPNTQLTLSMANSDDLLVAVSIFSLYESLDNLEVGWLQHLSGLKTLLNAVSAEQQTHMQVLPSITVGRRASFWNFARADYQASYVNHQLTYLDTDDMQLWHSCGLQIQENGSLYNDSTEIKDDPLHSRYIAELVAHTLLWLVLRVMNYIASDQDIEPTLRQARWLQLTSQLEEWYANLPQTFQPCAKIRYPLPSSRGASPNHAASNLTEVFFSMDVCAAALQLYSFARILLLLNQPVEANDAMSRGGRPKNYRLISSEAIKNAHQIIGIALGRPHPAVRVEMLLPLFIAGSCLDADEERKVVLELLRAIEKDTGCSTEPRCLELKREWGWNGIKREDVLVTAA